MRHIIFIIGCLVTSVSFADHAVPLTLAQALASAYQDNPRMIEARKSIAAAQGEKKTASSLSNPEIEMEVGGFKDNLDSISIKQRFDPIGVHHLKSKIAKNNISIHEQSLRSTWADVYVDVRHAYSRIILHTKELELQKNNLKAMRQFFSNVQIKYQGGQVFKNQFQRAKLALLKTQSDYLGADSELNIGKARLNLLLGRPRDTAFEIKEDLKEEVLNLDLEHLTQQALNGPQMEIKKLDLDSKKKNVLKEKLGRLPSYALGVQRTDRDDEKDYAAIVEFSIPIWNFNQGEIQKATAEKEMEETRFEAFKHTLDFEVYRLYQEARLSTKQLNLYKKALEEANEMFRLAGLRYREGDIGFMEYLDQVQASMDSRVQYYRGLYTLSHRISELERSVHGSLRGEEFFK